MTIGVTPDNAARGQAVAVPARRITFSPPDRPVEGTVYVKPAPRTAVFDETDLSPERQQ
jgi:hypothetical protein